MKLLTTLLLVTVLFSGSLSAYQVWLGTHKWEGEAADNLDQWDLAIEKIEGINYVLLDSRPDRPAGDGANNSDWLTMIAPIDQSIPGMAEIARSQYLPARNLSLAARLENEFATVENRGAEIDIMMLYDEERDGTVFEFTLEDVQEVRDWLDNNGEEHVTLCFNLRNNNQERLALAQQPIIDSILIEASATRWVEDRFNLHTLLQDLWTDPRTRDKNIHFQIPRSESPGAVSQRNGFPASPINQYIETRRALQVIRNLMGDEFMRSDQVIFVVCNYGNTYPTYPELTTSGANYVNSKSGLALSLIEQRSLFEGRSRPPTNADAESTVRLFPPTVGSILDQTLEAATASEALAFSVSDDVTPASALTISKTSSNSSLIPEANIVLGGSGGNRTVTVTPAPGLSGTAEIELWVSDGTLASPVAFSVTVLPSGSIPGVMFSDAADGSIKENPAVENLTSETVSLGARGSAPWVERCTVYVFQLPNLGATSNPFEDANFTFEFVEKNSTLRGHDLYGLSRRSSPQIQPDDFYSQTATADASDATRLQQSILTDSTPLGLVTTGTGGDANLVNYLNAQYAGGAGAGDYVFLRINTRAPKSGVNFATLTMSEGGVVGAEDTRPRITYRAVNPAPSITSIPNVVLPLNVPSNSLPFTLDDPSTPTGSLALSASSGNPALVPTENILFGGSGANRTVRVTPNPNLLGSTEITISVSNGSFVSDTTFLVTVEGVQEVMAGWDEWSSNTAPSASVTASGISATATASTATGSWSITDQDNDGRGSSGDGSWGSFTGHGVPASLVTSGAGANMTATNGKTDAEMTFTLTNNGPTDWEMDSFHMDVIAFRPNAPRTYQLEVLSGDLTAGVVFTSADDAIGELGGTLSGNHDDHEQIDLDLSSLADSTLESGGSAVIRLSFSSGTGSGGGHHLFVDNVAFSGATVSLSALESWRQEFFGTTENAGSAANDFDADGDGENNLLEFATGQNPNANTAMVLQSAVDENFFYFEYERSVEAVNEGVIFQVEWSDTLQPTPWSNFGVTEALNSDNGILQAVQAAIPLGPEGRRFARLRVTAP